MSLKNIVETTCKNFTDYKQPHQAVTQMASLGSLSGDLYQDSKRFIYELLQNADDAALTGVKSKVIIKLFNNILVVAHTGKTFDERDVIGISDVGNGTKKNASDKTGYKGIGFKSVFGQSNKVCIYSDGELFRFDETFEHDWPWDGTKEEWEALHDRSFKFPWPIIPIYTESEQIEPEIWKYLEDSNCDVATILHLYRPEAIRQALKELAEKIEMYLFLKNIDEIIFENDSSTKITIHEAEDGEINISINDEPKAKYHKKAFIFDVPESVQLELQKDNDVPDKIKQATKGEIVLAARRNAEGYEACKIGERNMYAYFPTEEKSYDIPVLVNASFYLAATRENLHKDNIWNKWIMSQVPIYLISWISELVLTCIESDAYTILPKKIEGIDSLTVEYNKSLERAKKEIAFIRNSDDVLLKVDETILDITNLSTKDFVGQTPVLEYKIAETGISFPNNPFAKDISNPRLKTFGIRTFEWKDFPKMTVNTPSFIDHLSIENNKLLIEYLKYQSLSEVNRMVNDVVLKDWHFILDHKGSIQAPNNLYFSEIGVSPKADSVLNFVHPQLEEWLENTRDVKLWLDGLNIKEKSDATFLVNTVVRNAEEFATIDNTIETIRKAAELLRKGDITLDIPPKLSKLSILTTQGNLVSADKCYLSNAYNPRVKIQDIIEDDIFVSADYITGSNLQDLKTLFNYMGISEGFSLIVEPRKTKTILIQEEYEQAYFDQHRNLYFNGHFTPYAYKGIVKFNLLNCLHIYEFSKLFWKDAIANTLIENIKKQATAFWGYSNRPGDTDGNLLENYLPWYLQNHVSIPGTDGKCYSAPNIFLNTDDILKVAGNYLPVFDGPQLNADWRGFFNFKTKFELRDYLDILTAISSNPDHKKTDQQKVIELILDDLTNSNFNDLEKIRIWGSTGTLSDLNEFYRSAKDLNFYIDGNSSDLGEGYHFAYFSQSIQKHAEFENFLKLIGITIIRQSDFKIQTEDIFPAKSLTDKLAFIFPYWAQWRRSEVQGGFEQVLSELKEKCEKYTFLQAEELVIRYGEHWETRTNQYLIGNDLYVVTDWKKLSVLLSLGNQLCQILDAPRLQDQLQFLLLSNPKEIEDYFAYSKIPLPPLEQLTEYPEESISVNSPVITESINSRQIPQSFYHIPEADFDRLNYTKVIIKRAVGNIIGYLNTLPEYDCTNSFVIAESVIGGIIKNGNEITVVARPSDKNYTLLYFTSEFDVLEYVDAELWCEDGVNEPKQITLGQLLKKTGINKIPVKNIDVSNDDLTSFITTPKNDQLDFNAVPFAPQKIAQIISSFANTNGGSLIFGIKEINPEHNEIVGLSNDFRIDEITKKAISFLQPIPSIEYDWVNIGDHQVYMIKTVKSDIDILFENRKFIRVENKSLVENELIQNGTIINNPSFSKTIAIIIAIENYHPKNQIKPVKYANADSQRFRDMLINDLNLDEQDIYILSNEDALKSSIEYDLKGLFLSLKEDDRLVFYYVGHGFHNGITNYLSTYDMHKNNIPGTAVSLQTILIDPLQNSKCKNALIFIDACAQSFIDENERNHWSNINEEELIILSQDFPNYSIFLSCHAGQSSYSSDILENGIWTHYLIEAIGGNVPQVINNSKYITDILLRDYLSIYVSDYAMQEQGKFQNPKAIIDSSFENVIRELN